MTLKFRIRLLWIALIGSLTAAGCEDLLPEYEQPGEIFSATYVRTDTDTLEFAEPTNGSGGVVASYGSYYVIFSITNVYEETFQYTINPKGTLAILLPNVVDGSSTATVTVTDLQPSSVYNASTGVLTLNPGSSIYFRMRIDPKIDNGFYIHTYASVRSTTNMGRQYYLLRIYDPLFVTARFTMQLSPDLPAITTEKIIAINLKGRFPYSP